MTGVIFSLVLVNIQGGMFLGLIRKSTLLIDNSEADIWIGHRGVQNTDITADIPVGWLNRIRGIGGVADAAPYIVAGGMLQLPSGGFEGVLVVGIDPASKLGAPWAFAESDIASLLVADAISIDQLDVPRLGNPQLGDVLEINHRRARIVAKTDGIVGFITTPYVFTTLESARIYGRVASDRCSYFLVQTERGANRQAVVEEIRRRLPDADVYTAEAFSWKTRVYWMLRTGLGMSFGGSTLLGLAVGLVMVAQSLYAFVLDHLEHYAALKAIGATDGQIGRILLLQGLAIALLGTVVGNSLSVLIWLVCSSPRLTIAMTPTVMFAATVLATLICLVSAWLPFRRICGVDPVMVLRG